LRRVRIITNQLPLFILKEKIEWNQYQSNNKGKCRFKIEESGKRDVAEFSVQIIKHPNGYKNLYRKEGSYFPFIEVLEVKG